MSEIDLLREIAELRKRLDRFEAGGFATSQLVRLAAALTSTSWDGDAFSTTAKTLIDLSAVFGAPAGVKAVLVRCLCRDSGSAGSTTASIILSPENGGSTGTMRVWAAGLPNDDWAEDNGIIPCDANGDIYYQIIATGASTLDVYLEIWGYWM